MVEKYLSHRFPCYMQLAIDIDHRKSVGMCVEKIRNVTASLHLTCNSDTVHRYDEFVNVHTFPESLKALDERIQLPFLSAPVQTLWPLAMLCANSYRAVLKSTHVFAAGVTFLNRVRGMMDPGITGPREILPLPMEHVLAKDLEEATSYPNL